MRCLAHLDRWHTRATGCALACIAALSVAFGTGLLPAAFVTLEEAIVEQGQTGQLGGETPSARLQRMRDMSSMLMAAIVVFFAQVLTFGCAVVGDARGCWLGLGASSGSRRPPEPHGRTPALAALRIVCMAIAITIVERGLVLAGWSPTLVLSSEVGSERRVQTFGTSSFLVLALYDATNLHLVAAMAHGGTRVPLPRTQAFATTVSLASYTLAALYRVALVFKAHSGLSAALILAAAGLIAGSHAAVLSRRGRAMLKGRRALPARSNGKAATRAEEEGQGEAISEAAASAKVAPSRAAAALAGPSPEANASDEAVRASARRLNNRTAHVAANLAAMTIGMSLVHAAGFSLRSRGLISDAAATSIDLCVYFFKGGLAPAFALATMLSVHLKESSVLAETQRTVATQERIVQQRCVSAANWSRALPAWSRKPSSTSRPPRPALHLLRRAPRLGLDIAHRSSIFLRYGACRPACPGPPPLARRLTRLPERSAARSARAAEHGAPWRGGVARAGSRHPRLRCRGKRGSARVALGL